MCSGQDAFGWDGLRGRAGEADGVWHMRHALQFLLPRGGVFVRGLSLGRGGRKGVAGRAAAEVVVVAAAAAAGTAAVAAAAAEVAAAAAAVPLPSHLA